MTEQTSLETQQDRPNAEQSSQEAVLPGGAIVGPSKRYVRSITVFNA